MGAFWDSLDALRAFEGSLKGKRRAAFKFAYEDARATHSIRESLEIARNSLGHGLSESDGIAEEVAENGK
jgi:hypothetical protein